MKTVKVYHYDAFTTTAGMGNPAGIILEAGKYNTDEMQKIAKYIGFSECAFVLPSDVADFRLRYFTPGAEVDLCGHATIASIYALFKDTDPSACMIQKTVETKAGIINVEYIPATSEISMTQADVKFEAFQGSPSLLMSSIGLNEDDIDADFPIVYGSTGLWTVIVPIKNLKAFSRMLPDNTKFSSILPLVPNASVHPICIETLKDHTTLHGRHFSPFSSGRIEDPITGTACGVMGAYYITYMQKHLDSCDIFIEQGQDAGYDGVVHVWAEKQGSATKVKIAGTAVKVAEIIAQI